MQKKKGEKKEAEATDGREQQAEIILLQTECWSRSETESLRVVDEDRKVGRVRNKKDDTACPSV